MMEKKRLRNLTTGRLHTDIGFVYQDLEFITGMKGLMTHMLPNIMRAVMPWLKEQVKDEEYWDDKYTPDASGEHKLEPMNEEEREEMLDRYSKLESPLEGKDILVVSAQDLKHN